MESFKTETALLMLSGGLDSSFLLYYLLNHTNLKVFTHHISHRYDQEPRWEQEDEAAKNVVEYCKKNYRDFKHSSSRFDFRGFPYHVGWDSDLQVLVAGKVCPNLLSNNISVVIGWTMDSIAAPRVVDRLERKVTSSIWTACRNSIDDVKVRNNINPKLWFLLTELKYYKEDIVRKCPKELRELTWSCRRPRRDKDGNITTCGRCLPCRQFKEIKEKI